MASTISLSSHTLQHYLLFMNCQRTTTAATVIIFIEIPMKIGEATSRMVDTSIHDPTAERRRIYLSCTRASVALNHGQQTTLYTRRTRGKTLTGAKWPRNDHGHRTTTTAVPA